MSQTMPIDVPDSLPSASKPAEPPPAPEPPPAVEEKKEEPPKPDLGQTMPLDVPDAIPSAEAAPEPPKAAPAEPESELTPVGPAVEEAMMSQTMPIDVPDSLPSADSAAKSPEPSADEKKEEPAKPDLGQTMPLLIYEAVVTGEDATALGLSLLLTGVSVTVMLLAGRLGRSPR